MFERDEAGITRNDLDVILENSTELEQLQSQMVEGEENPDYFK